MARTLDIEKVWNRLKTDEDLGIQPEERLAAYRFWVERFPVTLASLLDKPLTMLTYMQTRLALDNDFNSAEVQRKRADVLEEFYEPVEAEKALVQGTRNIAVSISDYEESLELYAWGVPEDEYDDVLTDIRDKLKTVSEDVPDMSTYTVADMLEQHLMLLLG